MKSHLFGLGAVALGMMALTACGGGAPAPAVYPYNPNASSIQSTDTRVPYRGDWVLAAKLSDGTERRGLISTSVIASDANFLNAGGGVGSWCVSTVTCTQNTEVGTTLIGSQGGKLVAGLVPRSTGTPLPARFYFTDTDGLVTVNNNLPTITGGGTWTNADGTTQGATFALVQFSNVPSVSATSLQVTAATLVATQALSQESVQANATNPALAQALSIALK